MSFHNIIFLISEPNNDGRGDKTRRIKIYFKIRVFRVYKKEENDNVFVNAIEMAKPFGKLPSGWTRSQYAQDFITTLSAMRNYIASDLLKVKNGDNGGTWMHEDVALEFARWLNPAFAIWCNSQINQSSITTGIPATLYFK
ncbi:KilA-N domain-containing protein [Elizabethkingia anophelis]|uniref:KilA-N domain-containing protein n=1 Tax=Elizabethkingia anophelis TaxID=1117645 RepID=UPI00099AE084|nr:KilA-N domain-containing protein [Elizabethkingia anophelis]MCT3792077.1 KilA-N domain-containing protein [Elizabethkingia anophelis]MCT3795647.1 KilA-N domain-containing protein [Elizabethkingia anophelis]MCT3799162.1 KilA-N domain-containing protein [Elizabethkingia anophelis]MCT3845993.1 KilA-N domain-containing protein [Elizabethkingia anophelis]MCT3992566.1 KilA-N domain-containing protein [Elizabethkingia anophelis]